MASKTVLALGWNPILNEKSEHPKPTQPEPVSGKPKLQILLPPRTLWTRCIEAVIEFSRVVFDLFYGEHFLSVVCADHVDGKKRTMISWELGDQRISQLHSALVSYQCPYSEPQGLPGQQNLGIINCLSESLRLIFQPTPSDLQNPSKPPINRILLISHISNEAQLSEIQKNISACLCSQTVLPPHSTQLDITLLNVYNDFSPPIALPKSILTPDCSFCCIPCPGSQVSDQIMNLCRGYFSLSSTIIKGIPMKEEQSKPAPSQNYDVELFHPQEAQRDFLRTFGHTSPPGVKAHQGALIFDFKWCTPKKSNLDFRLCSGSWRISPVQVSHRPTACLFTFLQSGNQVLLEHDRPPNLQAEPSAAISFILLSHNNAAFLHSIPHIPRSHLDDMATAPPAAGGRVADYRVDEFIKLMHSFTLVPMPIDLHTLGFAPPPCDQSMRRLLLRTHFLPLTQGESLLLQLSDRFEAILSTQELSALSEEKISACNESLSDLDAMMRKGEPLIQTRSIPKGKREDSYLHVWLELIYLLDGSRYVCEGAQIVYAHMCCLLENIAQEHMRTSLLSAVEEANSENMKHVNRIQKTYVPQADPRIRRLLSSSVQHLDAGMKRKLDGSSPQHSVPLSRPNLQTTRQPISLISSWSLKMEKEAKSRHVEFAGRLNSASNKAELYSLRMPTQLESSYNL